MWKIWFQSFDENGQQNGAGVCIQEYKYKRNAERMAKKRYGDLPGFKYIVSQTNPWERSKA